MAKKSYCGINNIARNIPNTGYCGVNDVARRLVKGYIGDSQGIARQFWDRSVSGWRQEADIPYNLFCGCAVTYKGKIHLFGGNNSGTETNHYTFDGTTWSQETAIPINMKYPSGVVFNGKIHLVYGRQHYTWDDILGWTQLNALSSVLVIEGNCHLVVYNSKLTLMSSNDGHYGWWKYVAVWDDNTDSWTYTSVVGSTVYYTATAYGGYIYLLGNGNNQEDQRWDGLTMAYCGVPEYLFKYGSTVVYNGKIHLLGTQAGTNEENKRHYTYDGNNYEESLKTPYKFFYGSACVFESRIHIFGAFQNDLQTQHWSYGEKIYYFKAEHTIDAYIHAIWVQPIYLLTEKDFVMVDENANRKYVVAIPQGVYGVHVVETAREYLLLICDHQTTTTLKEYNAMTGELVRTDTLYINQTSWKPSGKDDYYINTNVYWNTNSRDIETPLQPTVFESAWANNWGLWELGYIVFDGVVTPM